MSAPALVALEVSAFHNASSKEKDNIMTINIVGRLSRIAVGAMLVAAGATVASLLGTTATANAADQYVVVAVGLANDNPPVVSVGGMAVGTDEQQTGVNALSDCQNSGGSHCVMQAMPRTRALQQRPTTMASLQARPTRSFCRRRLREEQIAESTGRARRRVGLHGSAAAAAAAKPASGPQAGTDGLLGCGPGRFRGPHHGP